jgi:hypothetical protein
MPKGDDFVHRRTQVQDVLVYFIIRDPLSSHILLIDGQ